MSRTKLGILAVSALALTTAFAGYSPASADTVNSPIILAQAGGGAGGAGGGAGGGAESPGAGGSGAQGSGTFGGGADGPLAPQGRPPAAGTSPSPSAGVPEECAKMVDPVQRSACIDRFSRGTPPVRQ